MNDPLKGKYLGMPTEAEWRSTQAVAAAAPDLLKALQEIRDGLADTGSTPGQRMTTITKADAHRIADAAIRAATGGPT